MLQNYSEGLQKKFLLFTTGSDRVPVGGMGEMTFKITKLKVIINQSLEVYAKQYAAKNIYICIIELTVARFVFY